MRHIVLVAVAAVLASTQGVVVKNKDTTTNLSTLQFVQVFWRHGDRTPVVDFPGNQFNKDSDWTDVATGLSSVTQLGKWMHYRFGKYIRQRYDGFLNKTFSASEFKIQTSEAERAIMSGLANMAGLWPPTVDRDIIDKDSFNQWTPVPLTTVPKALDNFIHASADCPRFKELKRYYIVESDYAKQVNTAPETVRLCKILVDNGAAEQGKCNLETISDIWDTLHIHKKYNKPLPNWAKDELDNMKKIAPIFFDKRVLVPNEEVARVKVGPLMNVLVGNMEKKVKGEKVPKMYAISGHDTGTSFFLASLDMFETQFPYYTSAVFLELHKDNTNGHHVKVFWRNTTEDELRQNKENIYELEVPNCGYPCKYDKFRAIAQPIMVDDEEWKKACQSGNKSVRKRT